MTTNNIASLALTRVIQYGLVALAFFAALGPVVWVVGSSFKSTSDVISNTFALPIPPTVQGYRDAVVQVELLHHIGNTLLYAASAAILCPLVALLLAYPCTRLRFPLRKAITVLVASGVAIPGISLITPEFFVMLRTGLYDSKHGLIVFYCAILLPLAFVILRAFLLGVPREVEEAAAVDGASYYRTLFEIVLPLIRPGLLTVSILVFIAVWNDFLWNLLLAPGFENRNTQVILASFRAQFNFNVAGFLAGVTIVLTVPVLIFLLTQRYAIAGLTGYGAVGRTTQNQVEIGER